MRVIFRNKIKFLLSVLSVCVIAFSFMPVRVNAATLSELDGTHAFSDTYFNFDGSDKAVSYDGEFLLGASKYNLNSDDHSAWLDDADAVNEETAYLEVKNYGTLGSFYLDAVDLGEYEDGAFKDVHVEGYANGVKVFSTTPYSNLREGTAVKSFPLNFDAAKGKKINSFRICYTKEAGLDFGHYAFNIYSFKISNADTESAIDNIAPAAVTNITLADNDNTSGIDGRDFTIGFDDSADDAADIASYKIYIYKDGEEPADKAAMDALPAGSRVAVKTIARTAGDDGADASLGSGVTTDSKGQKLSAGDYWAIVTAQDAAGNYSFTKSPAKAAINDDMPPSVTLSIDGSPISENGGVATVTAALSSVSMDDVNVYLDFSGTAAKGTDYTVTDSKIVIPAGSLTGSAILTAKDNSVYEGDKTVVVDILGVSGGVESGTQRVTAIILEDEKKAPALQMPSDQNFDGKSASGTNSVTMDGITYTTNNNSIVAVGGCDNLSYNYTSASSTYSGNALTNDYTFSMGPTFFQISSLDLADNFKFNSMYYIATDLGDGHNINIEGLDGGKAGTLVASIYGIDMSTSGTYGSGNNAITLANEINDPGNSEYGGILTFGNNWNNIDTILITNNAGDTKAVYSVIDSLDFSNVVDVSVSDSAAVIEGENAKFKISLSKTYVAPVTVHYATADNTAKAANGDYTSTSGTATIPAGQTYVDVTIPTSNDTDYEQAESLYLNISNPSVGGVTDSQAECVINDNDSQPTVELSQSGSSFSEKDGTDVITATLSNKSYQPVTVDLSLTGSAINLTDYTIFSASIVIPAGSLTRSVTLTAKDNAVYEGDKTVIIDISNVTNGKEDGTQQVMTSILEDEPVPVSSQYLSSLTISSGTLTPVFNKNTYAYTATVGWDVTSITITPTAEVPVAYGQNATIKVNGVSVASGAGTPVNLALGVNTIYVDVTSAVGNVTQRYTLTVTRADSNYLSNLVLMNGTTAIPLNTAIAPATASYTASVDYDVSSITVTATKQSPNASITINGSPATSGQAFTVSNLAVGANTITVAVTTPGMAVQNYTVVVTKMSDTYLSNLTAATMANVPITLTPAFDKAVLSYGGSTVKNTKVRITATAHDPSNVAITVAGLTATSGASVTVTVTPGSTNNIPIVVKSNATGETKTYTCSIAVGN